MNFRNLLTGSLLCLLSHGSMSAIVLNSQGEINIPIPNTFEGVYLDFTDVNDPDSYSLTTTQPASWDINLFYGGAAIATSDTFAPVVSSATINSPLLSLAPGTQVGPSSLFPPGFSGSTGHMGQTSQQFESGSIAYLGFVLNPGQQNYYGWMKVTLNNDGTAGTIHEWAWDNSGAAIIVPVPEPSNVTLLLGLFTLLLGLRRRRNNVAA